MSTIKEQLNSHLTTTPKDTLEADFDELNHFNEVGPKVDDYFLALEECYKTSDTSLASPINKIDGSKLL